MKYKTHQANYKIDDQIAQTFDGQLIITYLA